jgi:P27 family predicted phage terminase small subunit
MGRHPLPTAIKKARGTAKPSRLNPNEPEFQILSKVSTPTVLKTARARRMFREKSAMLIAQNILQQPDIDMLTAYCNTYDLYLQAMEAQAESKQLVEVVQTKNGKQTISSPYIKLQRELLPLINQMGSNFGFSPVSRSKVIASTTDNDNDDFS